MARDQAKAREQWLRYVYARDTGHLAFVQKAVRCEDFVCGKQWDEADRQSLRASKRPAMTINKMLITLASVCGEQIETRSEISFRPRTGASDEAATIQTKVFKFISDQNKLDWVRSDVFADGAVTGRGFYDVRLDFEHNVTGDVKIIRLNPRNVIPDPDGQAYDPDTWNDVITTYWMTADEIEIYYNKADAEYLRNVAGSSWQYGYDSIDVGQDRFGGGFTFGANVTEEMKPLLRNIRVIERQHKVLSKVKMFVDVRTGMKRQVPDSWKKDEVAQFAAENPNLVVTDELVKRIRWTVTADECVLMDEWSPYKHFTVVPYFPVFRYGQTIGLIEGLIDPQELLNKTISQELHVVNTMANSGWMVKSGVLLNMTMDELEEMGAKTGLVLEVNAEDVSKAVQKITPNQIPQGLDRISFKAENFIKSISGRGDSVMGLDRADVSGKAIGEKKSSADVPLRPALDNLERTDHMLARNIIDIVQQYYTDPRIMTITHDDITQAVAQVSINQPHPGTGEVMNDLSLGEFDVVVVSQSVKRTLEESQFEQALAMKEAGIQIPDRFLIQNSNLLNKAEIVKQMDAAAQSETAQIREKAATLSMQLEVANLKADASATEAKALAQRAKAAKDMQELQQNAGGQDAEMQREQARHDQEMEMMREKHQMEMQIKREEAAMKIQIAATEAKEKQRQAKLETVMKAKQTAATPGTVDEAAKLAKAGGGAGAGAPGQEKARPAA